MSTGSEGKAQTPNDAKNATVLCFREPIERARSMVCCCPSSQARPRATKRQHNRHRGNSCWRNPFVVFFLSFATLGSLRFRVPARTAASSLLLQRREQHRLRRGTTKVFGRDADAMTSTSNSIIGASSLSYVLVEEGQDASNNKPSFQKYRAVRVDDDESEQGAVTVEQWARAMAAADEKDPAIVLLNKVIASTPFQAVYFETPPVTATLASLQQPMEFVLVDAPQLDQAASNHRPDVDAFGEPFAAAASEYGAVFANLGGDAVLVAPKPLLAEQEDLACYIHLASFVRRAPPHQVAALWSMVVQAYLDQLTKERQQPVWFSTSGLGIFWLHFRLDTVPKYYSFEPYKSSSRR